MHMGGPHRLLLAHQAAVTNLDMAALAAYCVSYARWLEAEKALRQTCGLMLKAC